MDLWPCRRPIGRNLYPGSYPQGFVPRFRATYGLPQPFMHLCCGSCKLPGAVNVDINPAVEPDVLASMHQLPFPDGHFAFTLWDPPYGRHWAQKYYHQRHLRIGAAFKEVVRVTKPGGHIALLYQYPIAVTAMEGLQTVALHGILCGPQKHLRLLQVWQKGMFAEEEQALQGLQSPTAEGQKAPNAGDIRHAEEADVVPA